MNRLPDHLDEVDGNAAVAAYQDFTDAVLDGLAGGPTRLRLAILDAAELLERRLTAIFEHPSRPARRLAPVPPLSPEERGELHDALRRAFEERNAPGWRPAP
jgi:hypothetical protein